jgi:hypothetical protein
MKHKRKKLRKLTILEKIKAREIEIRKRIKRFSKEIPYLEGVIEDLKRLNKELK